MDRALVQDLNFEGIVNMFNKNVLAVAVASITLAGCASGGGGATASAPAAVNTSTTNTSVTATQPVAEDNRYAFDDIVTVYTPNLNRYSDNVTVTVEVLDDIPTNLPARTDKFRIEDYGFMHVTVDGHHGGYEAAEESSLNNTFIQRGEIAVSDINGDGHEDFYVYHAVGEHVELDWRPNSLVYAFINDGTGHFTMDNSVFGDNQPCLQGMDHNCAKNNGLSKMIVADFNNDGMDDIYRSDKLYLSNNGKLYDTDGTIPTSLFDNCFNDECFWHDNEAGDITGDGSLDIFIPFWNHDKNNEPMPWSVLINNGAGQFSVNQKLPSEPQNYFATTAVVADFDNDGKGDIAVGWFQPGQNQFTETYENSAGLVFFNDGNDDFRNRPWVELPDNYFGKNGNANDMKAFDFDNDGLIDIVLASTKHDPYYDGRMVQFFKNQNGTSFIDVTADSNNKYASGLNNGYWNGEGEMHIVDFDHDGDLDVVDSVQNTYVLLNDGEGNFTVYDDFPRFRNGQYFPIEIDNKYWYDFIGVTEDTNGLNQSTYAYYQVLDPPSIFEQMMNDIKSKPKGYVDTAFSSKVIFEDLRSNSNSDAVFGSVLGGTQTVGFSSKGEQSGVIMSSFYGDNKGYYLGANYTKNSVKVGVGYIDSEISANNDTIWYGTGTANLNTKSVNLYAEKLTNLTNNMQASYGLSYYRTRVNGFLEESSDVNFSYDSFDTNTGVAFVNVTRRVYSQFGRTLVSLTAEHYRSLNNTDVDFSNGLRYSDSNELTVGKLKLTHYMGPFYVRASVNTEKLNSYELGFQMQF